MIGRARVLGVALTLGVLVMACGGNAPPVAGKGCWRDKSAAWGNVVSEFTMPVPLSRCPYKLNTGSPRIINDLALFEFHSGANADTAPQGQYFYYWTKNTRDAANNVVAPFIQDEGYWLQQRVSFDGQSPPSVIYHMALELTVDIGRTPESASLPQRDSLRAYFRPANGAPGAGWYVFVSTIETSVPKSSTSSLVGPAAVPVGGANEWSHSPFDGDTTGYRYQWYIDGSLQPADTGARITRNFATAGTYTLRVDQSLVDTTFTYSKTVTIQLGASISGPSEVSANTPAEFSASAGGGTAPYSYVWAFNGDNYTNGSNVYSPGFVANSTNTVTVTATDATGKTGSAQMAVYAVCDPADPNCYAQLRMPPPPTGKTAPAKRRDRPAVPR